MNRNGIRKLFIIKPLETDETTGIFPVPYKIATWETPDHGQSKADGIAADVQSELRRAGELAEQKLRDTLGDDFDIRVLIYSMLFDMFLKHPEAEITVEASQRVTQAIRKLSTPQRVILMEAHELLVATEGAERMLTAGRTAACASICLRIGRLADRLRYVRPAEEAAKRGRKQMQNVKAAGLARRKLRGEAAAEAVRKVKEKMANGHSKNDALHAVEEEMGKAASYKTIGRRLENDGQSITVQ